MSAFSDYFHLKRDTFSIDPWRDAERYFGSQKPQQQILDRLEQDFVSARGVPKFVVLGRYGGGKTHTLAHIAYELTNGRLAHDFPSDPIYLEIAPIKAKEQWATVHRRILDAIGVSRVKQAITGVVAAAGTGTDPMVALKDANVLRYGEEALTSSQAQIFRNLLFGGMEQLSWEWLKGRALTMAEAQLLMTGTNLTEPADYVNALLNVASLLEAGIGKKPVLLIDEGEAFGNLTNADSINEIVTVLRRLLSNDNTVLGMVLSVQSDGGMDDAPRILTREELARRIDYEQGYIDLADLVLDPKDAKEFIVKALEYLVDQDAAKAVINEKNLQIEPEFYPFTEEGVDQIAEWVTQVDERASPSQIMSILSGAIGLAWRRRHDGNSNGLVTDEMLEDVMHPDERE